MFIETSAPRVAGNRAWLVSQQFQVTQMTVCLQFWYNMNGNGVGKFNSVCLHNRIHILIPDTSEIYIYVMKHCNNVVNVWPINVSMCIIRISYMCGCRIGKF